MASGMAGWGKMATQVSAVVPEHGGGRVLAAGAARSLPKSDSPRRQLSRPSKIVASLALAFTATVGMAGHAAAASGPYTIARGECAVGNGLRDLYAAIPSVWSINRTYGSGNDRQLVNYWVRLFDFASGTVLTNWAFAGASYANDNVPTAFAPAGKFGPTNYNGKWRLTGFPVRVQYLIAWYTPDGSTLLGSAQPSVTSYRLWAFGTNAVIGISYAC